MHINIEIKARCEDIEKLHGLLMAAGASYRGEDHQRDTYFRCGQGRLKLRQGNIENALIHYQRSDLAGPKVSAVTLYPAADAGRLRQVLEKSLGVLIVVDKKRRIYYIENVKFHLDEVQQLGFFAEIEAIDADGMLGEEKLRMQCDYYRQLLGIQDAHLLAYSYSDLLMSKAGENFSNKATEV
jgi:adenylate cyclase class 2